MFVEPALFHSDCGFGIGVNNGVDAMPFQSLGQLGNKELGAAVVFGRNRNERRSDETDSHVPHVPIHG